MTPRQIDVFFYGLFMDEQLLRSKGVSPSDARKARVSGYALRIGNRATLVATPGATAYGLVMKLTHDEIEKLYSEPSVRTYRAEALLAEVSEGKLIPVLCFNLIDPPSLEEANAEYAAKLRSLASRLALPSAYIASIR